MLLGDFNKIFGMSYGKGGQVAKLS